jgi:hypothetical protein
VWGGIVVEGLEPEEQARSAIAAAAAARRRASMRSILHAGAPGAQTESNGRSNGDVIRFPAAEERAPGTAGHAPNELIRRVLV